MRLYYFAYGSNMLAERLRRRVRSAQLLGPAVLPGFALVFHKRSRDGSGKCDIVPSAADQVWGGLYRIVLRERPALDRAEGFGYQRRKVTVRRPGSPDPIEAFSYRARSGATDPDLRPYDWYRALVLRGAERLALPAEYLAALRAAPCRVDVNRGRARRNQAIVRAADSRRPHRQPGFDRIPWRDRRHASGRQSRL